MKDKSLLDKRAIPTVNKLHRYCGLSRSTGSLRKKKKYIKNVIREETNLIHLINIITDEREKYKELCALKMKESA